MAITYPLPLPTIKGIAKVTFRARTIVAVTQSPFSGVQQVQKHGGQWWEAEITLPPMVRANAEEWNAFLTKLNGAEGTFLMGDPSAATPRGSASSAPGTPLVNGSSQTGNTLNIDGAPNDSTGYLKMGDYIQLGSSAGAYLFKILENVDSSSTGAVALTVWPELNTRNQPSDNDAVIITNAKGRFRLVNNEVAWSAKPLIYNITFPVRSVI